MNLNECDLELTANTKKLNIRGVVKSYPVKKIPLDYLYYNSKNDRIATWISKYEAENGSIENLEKDELNNVIEEYIEKADPVAFKKTKNNIKALSQLEAGVVFSDGRVIDGNRRYTCLRKLYKETGDQKFGYFEAVVLDNTVTNKEIKIMELELQHGKEEKVDYNPVEKLVGVYRDIVRDKLITVEEYARSIDKKTNYVKDMIEQAELMIDFLEYINAPEQFYVARELAIQGQIEEVARAKKSIKDPDRWESIKIVLFDTILMKTSQGSSKDSSRIIRSLVDDVCKNDEIFEDYYEKHLPFAEQLNDIVNSTEIVSTSFINEKVRGNIKLSNAMSELLTDTLYDIGKDKAKNAPTDLINSALKNIRKVDPLQVSKYKGQSREDLKTLLDELTSEISKIEEELNNF